MFKKQLDKLQQKTETKEETERIIELTKEKYIFCAYARKRYLNGDENVKREILEDLGSNREIKDKKVLISLEKWFIPIYLMTKKHNDEMARLEPEKFSYDYNKNEALYRLRSSWLGGWGSNPRPTGYSVSFCFQKGWTISSPTPILDKTKSVTGARRFLVPSLILRASTPNRIVSEPSLKATTSKEERQKGLGCRLPLK